MYLTATLLFCTVTAPPVPADVLIMHAEIHDGRGGRPSVGNIAIHGDRITAVGAFEVAGNPHRIDATGLVAAPGFIDLHNHSDRSITAEKTRINKNYLTQGVTTIVTGNCGGGRADVAAYLAAIDEHGAGTNVAHLIPQGSVRRTILKNEPRPPSPDELDRMKEQIRKGMQAGAWGMSTGLIYVPSKYADTSELVALAQVVAHYDGLYVTHMRNEGTRLLESIEEALEIGRKADLPVHLSHFKAIGFSAWGLAGDAVRLVQSAREAGQPVTADQYPYVASSTSLGAMVVPDRYRNTDALREALEDETRAAEVKEQIRASLRARRGGSSLFIAGYAAQRAWQGKDLASLAEQQNRDVLDLVLEIQLNGGAQMVNFGINEEEVRLIMREPFVATASDGSAKTPGNTVPHPRNYGTFPRKIGYYAIEGNVLPLAQAIRSCSGLPADILGMTDRGYLETGKVADVVLFDPHALRDTATFQKPHQYATGVRYLLVNGQLAIRDGRVTGVLAGKALRKKPADQTP